jgi:hypothetical protein
VSESEAQTFLSIVEQQQKDTQEEIKFDVQRLNPIWKGGSFPNNFTGRIICRDSSYDGKSLALFFSTRNNGYHITFYIDKQTLLKNAYQIQRYFFRR